MTLLEDTLAALDRNDLVAALSSSIAAWQACRNARIAAIVDQLGARVAATRPRPTGKSVTAKQLAWLHLADSGDAGDLGNLLVTLTEIRKAIPLGARLRWLAELKDPRLATALVDLLGHPPIPGSTGAPVLRQAVEILIAIADPRCLPRVEQLAATLVNATGGGLATYALKQHLPWRLEALRQAIAAVEVSQLSVEVANIVDAIETRLVAARTPAHREADASALFAAVYADPTDDNARAVLADVLQERGDPRGELIALQLARAAGGKRSKRESELLSLHAREWLGPIAPAVLKTGLVYERGFVGKCAVRLEGIPNADKLVGLPEWRTVTEVDVGAWYSAGPLIDGMPILRVLSGIRYSVSVPSHPTIERLSISMLDNVDRFLAVELPALRELEIESCHRTLAEMTSFWRSERCAKLRRLTISAHPINQWIPAMAKLGVQRVGYAYRDSYPWRLWFEGDELGVQYIWGSPTTRDTGPLAEMLGHVPDPGRRRLVIDTPVPVDGELAAALGRFASHQLAEYEIA